MDDSLTMLLFLIVSEYTLVQSDVVTISYIFE